MNVARRALLLACLCAGLVQLTAPPAARSADPQRPGELAVRDAWARATPPGMGVAAVYLTITGGARADTLRAAATPVAAMTQIHAVTEADGMTRMREADGVDVPAHGKVVLAPGGLHLMLMGLERPLAPGDRFEVTLEFAKAGRRVVSVAVIAPDQLAPGGS